jgi:allantoinase
MTVHQKKLSPTLIAKVMDYNPAKIFGFWGRKGAFEIGFDADIVILDPEKPWTCEQDKLFTKGHVSCFDGLSGKGAPVKTFIRGNLVAEDGRYLESEKGTGEFIRPIK